METAPVFTPKNLAIVLILVFIVSLASWSKLRFVDEGDHEQQRWRVEEYPGFMKKEKPH
jgi:hypothetical protein